MANNIQNKKTDLTQQPSLSKSSVFIQDLQNDKRKIPACFAKEKLQLFV